MKREKGILLIFFLMLFLVACEDNTAEMISKEEFNEVVSEMQNAKQELDSLRTKVENVQNELTELKTYIAEREEKEEEIQVGEAAPKKSEGLTMATDPIVVPDPSTQSKLVVELTTENFLSLFEAKAVNMYDTWGEYSKKMCGFSSLLYEQGWALGKVEDFAVEYSIFDEPKGICEELEGIKHYLKVEEDNEDISLQIYRAKGTLTFYPVETVSDDITDSPENYMKSIIRTLPDGSWIGIYTDIYGEMVY